MNTYQIIFLDLCYLMTQVFRVKLNVVLAFIAVGVSISWVYTYLGTSS